jgi:Protein of unknown function (DUF3800)
MFTAYFDESSTHAGSSLIVIAGGASDDVQWSFFEAEWKGLLEEFKVPYFHMRKFAHSIGPFASWKRDEKRRRQFIKRLVGILRRRVTVSIGLVLLLDAYHEVVTQEKLRDFGTPYALCGNLCVRLAGEWAQRRKHDEPIKFVFESGARDAAELQRGFNTARTIEAIQKQYRMGCFEFAGKKDLGALQAADFIAWELHKTMVEYQKDPRRRVRESLLSLTDVPHVWHYINTPALRALEDATRKK